MGKLKPETLREVEAAYERYEAEVRGAGLQRNAEQTYLLHAYHFLRWLRDDFTPGERLKKVFTKQT